MSKYFTLLSLASAYLLPHSTLKAQTAPAAHSLPPNIIYILADDMGQGDVSIYNPTGVIPTPNIDKIATDGIRFTDTHTNSSVCTPTRYGILTGRYAWRTKLKQGVLQGHSPHLISNKRETVPSFLKKQGYKTACIGKWHLGMDWKDKSSLLYDKKNKYTLIDLDAPISNGPLDVGFDYYYGISASLNMDPHAFIENRQILGDFELLKNRAEATARGFTQPSNGGWAAKEYEQQDVLPNLAKKSKEWIKQNKSNPFFLYLPLPSPHAPITPSKVFQGKGVSSYADFCIETDWVVGQVLQALEETDQVDNTLIIFTADNGSAVFADMPMMHKLGHYPSLHFRGMKGTLWEGGHRVPFVLRWPKGSNRGEVCDQLICTTDLLATCAELFNKELADSEGQDSLSFLPAMRGHKIPESDTRIITHHSDAGHFAIRKGKWKLLLDSNGGSRRWNPKDTRFSKEKEILLFNMENDPQENRDLSAQKPKIVESLKQGLANIIQTGRSNRGKPQPSDHAEVEWPQIDSVRSYIK